MEVGNQRIYHVELIPRINKQFAIPAIRFETAGASSRFQRAHHRRPDSDDFSRCRPRRADARRHSGRKLDVFRMHVVQANIFHRHRLKCPNTDMQSQRGGFYPIATQSLQQFLREVQASRRRSNGPLSLGVNALIPRCIFCSRRAFDIGRQRHLANPRQNVCKRSRIAETNLTVPVSRYLKHLGDEFPIPK